VRSFSSGNRIVVVGEGMLELSPRSDGGWNLGHGGDTLNTAIHLARSGCEVAFFSAIGTDDFSETLRSAWRAEGIDDTLLIGDPDRTAGLYAIQVDASGERSFSYWRGQSAARHMFELPQSEACSAAAATADLLVFSLISLAILPRAGRDALFDLARQVRSNGGRVAFDGNYRPRLWDSQAQAAAARDAAIAVSDIGLPTLDDERALSGLNDADSVARHWQTLGCAEVVVKLGSLGCLLPDGSLCAPDAVLQPVDTSGAGDAFNAAYLASRTRRLSCEASARQGHLLAGWSVMRFGAIPPRDDSAPY
jgi:2-dehydro-3-deoxygluconokinase